MTEKLTRLLFLLLAAAAASAQTPADLPSPLRAALDREYHGWSFGSVSPEVRSYFRGKPLFPNFILGDFDGDCNRDYAVKIASTENAARVQRIIVFLHRGKDFLPRVLDTAPENPITYLWLAAKGTNGFDHESEKEFVYQNDAISLVFHEKASVSYIYEASKFRPVITGD